MAWIMLWLTIRSDHTAAKATSLEFYKASPEKFAVPAIIRSCPGLIIIHNTSSITPGIRASDCAGCVWTNSYGRRMVRDARAQLQLRSRCRGEAGEVWFTLLDLGRTKSTSRLPFGGDIV